MLYKQEGHPEGKVHLSEAEYRRALRSFVKYCHDILIIGPEDKFYLPRRREGWSLPGPWFVGGAVAPFTDILTSLTGTAEREIGIRLPHTRFTHIGQNRYFLSALDEIPQDAVCEIFSIRMSLDEIGRIQLDPHEYEVGSLLGFDLIDIGRISNQFVRVVFTDLWKKLTSLA